MTPDETQIGIYSYLEGSDRSVAPKFGETVHAMRLYEGRADLRAAAATSEWSHGFRRKVRKSGEL